MTKDITIRHIAGDTVLLWLESDKAKQWADRLYIATEMVGNDPTSLQRVGSTLPVPTDDLPSLIREAEAAGLFIVREVLGND